MKRLTDGEGNDPFSARLLSAGKKDRPTSDRVSRAVALAIASSAVVPPPAAPAAASGASALKIGLVAIGLSALALTSYAVLAPSHAAPIASPVATSTSTSMAPVSVAAPTFEPNHEQTVSVEDLPTAPSVTARPVVVPPAASVTPSDASPSLRDELVKLQAARRLLREGDATGALTELASYRREFPSGSLRAEEAALRIDAEVAAGNRERAKALAEQFLVDFPSSPEAARVHAVETGLESP